MTSNSSLKIQEEFEVISSLAILGFPEIRLGRGSQGELGVAGEEGRIGRMGRN